MRSLARIAMAVGAVGSIALFMSAATTTPRLLIVLFWIWIMAPFAALAWAWRVSTRWSPLTQTTLYSVTTVIALVSLAFYARVLSPPAGSPRAAVFVAVPPLSLLLMTAALSIAALVSRRRSSRGESRPPGV